MMYAAGLPKIAILLASMDAIECKQLQETPEINSDLNAMICRSDNHASTRMIDRLGYDKIEQVLTDSRYELYDEQHGGGLWVGKRYAATAGQRPTVGAEPCGNGLAGLPFLLFIGHGQSGHF
ncbi:MAG: hypothetical protein R2788_07980 [Saprospiraceae bacterium]